MESEMVGTRTCGAASSRCLRYLDFIMSAIRGQWRVLNKVVV